MKIRIRLPFRVRSPARSPRPVLYEIVCWDEGEGDWVVLERVGSKRAALEAVRRLRSECPSGEIYFVREGFRPLQLAELTNTAR